METKEVWVVTTNTDLTEGRGKEVGLAFCEQYATARRIGKGKYVQAGRLVQHLRHYKCGDVSMFASTVTVEYPAEEAAHVGHAITGFWEVNQLPN